MKKLTRIATLAAGAALITQAAQAGAPNDIILNFASVGTPSGLDYTIDLGNASASVGVGGSSVVNLSGQFNIGAFNAAFTGAPNAVNMGAVGGGGTGVGGDLFVTQLRSTLQPDPDGNAIAGSHLTGSLVSGVQASGAAIANGIPAGLVPQANPQSWTAQSVGWQTTVGINPQSSITSPFIQEDLYQEVGVSHVVGGRPVVSGTWDYVGFLTLDLSSDTLTFTPENLAAVPEPSTYGILAGFGLLALSLRRQLSRKQA